MRRRGGDARGCVDRYVFHVDRILDNKRQMSDSDLGLLKRYDFLACNKYVKFGHERKNYGVTVLVWSGM